MKKSLLMLVMLICFSSYGQTNELSNPQITFAVNVIPQWSVVEQYASLKDMQLPDLSKYDPNTRYGSCMRKKIMGCYAWAPCRAACFTSILGMAGCPGGWNAQCIWEIMFDRSIVAPVKPLTF